MEYKVIKAFDGFEKGNVFVEKENGIFEFREICEKPGYREEVTVEVNKGYIDEMVEEGNLIAIEKEDCNCCEKLEEVKQLIDELLETYENDYNSLIEEYEQGDVQPCVKVEAETVYFNLTKVLNKIKEVINE